MILFNPRTGMGLSITRTGKICYEFETRGSCFFFRDSFLTRHRLGCSGTHDSLGGGGSDPTPPCYLGNR